jgi:hypothetical protein
MSEDEVIAVDATAATPVETPVEAAPAAVEIQPVEAPVVEVPVAAPLDSTGVSSEPVVGSLLPTPLEPIADQPSEAVIAEHESLKQELLDVVHEVEHKIEEIVEKIESV